MYGKCQVCGKEGPLTRTSFRYPIKCECHNKSHFYSVDHHRDCEPKEPPYQNINLKTEDLQNPVPMALNILRNTFNEGHEPGSYYDSWVVNIACCIIAQFPDNEDNWVKANTAAKSFIDLLVQE